MNINPAVISAVYAARNNSDRLGYMHHVFVMLTSAKWSAL